MPKDEEVGELEDLLPEMDGLRLLLQGEYAFHAGGRQAQDVLLGKEGDILGGELAVGHKALAQSAAGGVLVERAGRGEAIRRVQGRGHIGVEAGRKPGQPVEEVGLVLIGKKVFGRGEAEPEMFIGPRIREVLGALEKAGKAGYPCIPCGIGFCFPAVGGMGPGKVQGLGVGILKGLESRATLAAVFQPFILRNHENEMS